MSTASPSHGDEPDWYEIRLQGRLDARWSAHLEGMTLTSRDGITLLEGAVADQSALHGLLQQLRDIGLPLVSVIRVATDAGKHPIRNTSPTRSQS